jgi:hypothetical protein
MALTDSEAKRITGVLSKTCSMMGSGIVRLFLASPNPKADKKEQNSIFQSFPFLGDAWADTQIQGACVLVVDRSRDAVLIQIYDIDTVARRFEYEMYYGMEYFSLNPQFHAFEMDDCVAGLCFSSKEVARKFLAKARSLVPDPADAPQANSKGGGGFFGVGKKKGPPQISAVLNVQHKQHVGLNNDGSFNLNELSNEWKALFKRAGVKKADLKDANTAKVIMQTITANGYSLESAPGQLVQASPLKPIAGPAAVKREVAAKQPPPVPEDSQERYTQQHRTYSKAELKAGGYNDEQAKAYEEYLKQVQEYEKAMQQYQDDLAEYERLMKLEQWEEDQKDFLVVHEEEKRTSVAAKYTQPTPEPPPLPPRKKKDDNGGGTTSPKNSVVASAPAPPPRRNTTVTATTTTATSPPPTPVNKTNNNNNNNTNAHASQVPQPHVPAAPAAPKIALPELKKGAGNPMADLQSMLNAVKLNPVGSSSAPAAPAPPPPRGGGGLYLQAIAGSTINVMDTSNVPSVKRTDDNETQNLMGMLAAALTARRAQLTAGGGGGDSDDDWSD